MIKKEIIWLIGVLAATIFIMGFVFGFDHLIFEKVEYTIHDTYFVIQPWEFLMGTGLLLHYLITFIRALFAKFRKNTTNFFLIGNNLILLLLINKLHMLFYFLRTFYQSIVPSEGWTVEPSTRDNPLLNPATEGFKSEPQLFIILLFLLLVTSYISFPRYFKMRTTKKLGDDYGVIDGEDQ